jgi:hypothetical protein
MHRSGWTKYDASGTGDDSGEASGFLVCETRGFSSASHRHYMTFRTESSGLMPLFRLLVTYRLLVYFGGLFVIGLPLLFEALGIELPGTARVVLVIVTLAVMVLTYIGERRLGLPDSRTKTTTEEYPLKMRLALTFALIGIGVGIYVALEVNTLTGLLFIAGAYLFGYIGYQNEFGKEDI